VKSIRTRLLVWLISGVVLIGIAGGWVVYRNALVEADAFFDYHLRQTALILRDQPVEYSLTPHIPDNDASYDFVVQVWSLDGVRIYLSRPHSVLPDITTLGFSTADTSEGRWRVYGTEAMTKVIQVAQPMRVREQQAVDLAVKTLRPFALLLPVLGFLIWLAVGSSLEPLQRLTSLVKARRVDALDPLPNERLPEEVQPLVDALNDLLIRLDAALTRERAFMADAAHELRTPLTALHLQMGTLARAQSEAERNDAMEKLSAGVQRAIRLVEQMLSLARQEPRAELRREHVPLADIVREVVAELVPFADAKQIDLGISNSEPARVLGDPDALRTLTRNLVDNAVRYTPNGGRVDVALEIVSAAAGDTANRSESTEKQPATSSNSLKSAVIRSKAGSQSTAAPAPEYFVILKIIDNGPGIPPHERSRVLDRFYRQPGTSPPGSGLGMAIVKAIADAHGAALALDAAPGGIGLAVSVRFSAIDGTFSENMPGNHL
jgi:two-component system, OmpR family, sensor kinase